MAQLATKGIEQAALAPTAAIDRGQLARMTFGDRSLEREVLQLFDRQAELLLARMRGGGCGGGRNARAYAERLGRRASGLAAWNLRPRRVERAAGTAEGAVAVGRLAAAIDGSARGNRGPAWRAIEG